MSELQRKSFEEWFFSEVDGSAIAESLCWQAWQAALESVVAELDTALAQNAESEKRISQFTRSIVELSSQAVDLQNKRDELERQNAELVAQVVAFSKALKNQLNDCINFDGGKLTDLIMEHSGIILKSTPTQHLRDIQAEAGRVSHFKGYMLGYEHAMTNKEKCEPAVYAQQHAERVKAGEV